MKIVILNCEVLPRNFSELEALSSIESVTCYENTPDHLAAQRIGAAEIAFTDNCRITAGVIDQCPDLKYIGILATGCDSVDLDYARKRGIEVCNAPGYAAKTVAQHGFALLLHLCCHVHRYAESVVRGQWDHDPEFPFAEHPQMELSGRTMGIIGYGPIGQSMASIAAAFGMKVLVFSSHPDPSLKESGIVFAELDQVIEKADVLSLNCPIDDSRRRMIDAGTISSMKEGVILLNTARGGLIDEEALAGALRSGKVSAAGLDVLTNEPPTENCPLIGLSNCVITPHIGWNSEEAQRRLLRISMDNLKEFLRLRRDFFYK